MRKKYINLVFSHITELIPYNLKLHAKKKKLKKLKKWQKKDLKVPKFLKITFSGLFAMHKINSKS